MSIKDGLNKGQHLSADTLSYFRSLLETLDSQTPDAEERILLINAAHEELQGKEYRLAVNKYGAHALQRILGYSTSQQIREFLHRIKTLWFPLSCDVNACYVLESALTRVPAILMEEKDIISDYQPRTIEMYQQIWEAAQTKKKKRKRKRRDADGNVIEPESQSEPEPEPQSESKDTEPIKLPDTTPPLMRHVIHEACDELSTHWIPLMHHKYGTYTVRHLCDIVAGVMNIGKQESQPHHQKSSISTPKLNRSHVKTLQHVEPAIVTAIETLPQQQLKEIASHAQAGPVIQKLLDHLSQEPSQHQALQTLCAKLLLWKQPKKDESESDSDDDEEEEKKPKKDEKKEQEWIAGDDSKKHVRYLLSDRSGSHLIERILTISSSSTSYHFATWHLLPELAHLANDGIANFVIQKWLITIKDIKMLETVVDLLQGEFEVLIANNRTGVIWRLVEACARLSCKQKVIIKALGRALNIGNMSENQTLVESLLTLTTPSSNTSTRPQRSKYNLNGSLIVQALMGFPVAKNTVIYDSLLAIKPQMLYEICTDATGSRVIDVMLTSGAAEKYKHALVEKLKTKYADLSCDRYGSFIMEKLYIHSDLAHKTRIATELSRSEQRLNGNNSGRVIWNKLRMNIFKYKQQSWAAAEEAAHSKLAMFSDILEDDKSSTSTSTSTHEEHKENKKSKRKRESEVDEMDELFEKVPTSKAATSTSTTASTTSSKSITSTDADMNNILEAIQNTARTPSKRERKAAKQAAKDAVKSAPPPPTETATESDVDVVPSKKKKHKNKATS